MKKQNSRKKQEKKQRGLPFPYYILMIPVVLGFIIPLVVRGYSFKIATVFENVSLSNGGVSLDVFLKGKQIWLYWVVAIALFFLLCFKLLDRKIVYTRKWMIFGGIYLLCAFISALTAEDVRTAFLGGEDLFQGFLVLFAYFILFYYTYMIFCGEKDQRRQLIFMFLRCALGLSLVLIILGSLQFCGNDPFSWGWVQKLCNISGAQIVEDNRIYLTLYNSNYVGVMTILLLPILFVGILAEQNKWMKILFGIGFIGMLGCLIASGSKTAILVMVVMVAAGSILVIILSKKWRKVAGVILVFAVALCAVIIFVTPDIMKINQPLKQQGSNLTGMATESDCFKIEVDGQELSISWDNDGIKFVSKDGTAYKTKEVSEKRRSRLLNKLPSAMTSYYGESQFQPERVVEKTFKNIVFFRSGLKYNGKNITGFVFYINKHPFFITNQWENKGYHYYNLSGKFVKISNSEDAFSQEVYGFASYRGYIWSKTIPLLKETVILGEGMDHFSLSFPNQDYAAKARIGKVGVTYNKPHSWYLQIGIESGVLSLFCFVVMILYILIEGIKNIKNETGLLKTILIGCGLSILGYCLMNILNDQMIVTAPVFWLILGVYASISNCLKEE